MMIKIAKKDSLHLLLRLTCYHTMEIFFNLQNITVRANRGLIRGSAPKDAVLTVGVNLRFCCLSLWFAAAL